MKRIGFFAILQLLFACAMHAQGEAAFVQPFDFPITFSGNFGELRANHFHGGLDFKTGGASGKRVRALADGYISRIRVTHGSGYMLDVTYHNGYSTINRHLNGFVGEVAKRVEEAQYRHESWEVDITPQPDEYPVKQGEIIALSGNTGYSFGPHLHLDLIETATGEYVDPLPFFATQVKDHTAPRAQGFRLYAQLDKGVVNGKTVPQNFPIQPNTSITAWGRIGAALKAYDYMDGVNNRYGVKHVSLEVDGKEVFRSEVSRFASSENRYINAWTEQGCMKSFIDPGNKLRMLHASNGQQGWVDIDEERAYLFCYTMTDALGNSSKLRFAVIGKRTEIPRFDDSDKTLLKWNKVNKLQEPGMTLVIPKGNLYEDIYVDTQVKWDSTAVAATYQLSDKPVPLHTACELNIRIRNFPVADRKKYYMLSVSSKTGKKSYVGGSCKEGVMQGNIRELGTYTVGVDTVPPVITPLNAKMWMKKGRIVFKVVDRETAIQSYRGTIGGKYVLFGKPNSIDGNLVYKLDRKRLPKGKQPLLLVVTDACGNESVYKTTIML